MCARSADPFKVQSFPDAGVPLFGGAEDDTIIAAHEALEILSQRPLVWSRELDARTDSILAASDYTPGSLPGSAEKAFYDLLDLWQDITRCAEAIVYVRNTTFVTGDTGGTQ